MIYLGLFKVIFYFPMENPPCGESIVISFWGHPLSKSKFTIDLLIKKCGFP